MTTAVLAWKVKTEGHYTNSACLEIKQREKPDDDLVGELFFQKDTGIRSYQESIELSEDVLIKLRNFLNIEILNHYDPCKTCNVDYDSQSGTCDRCLSNPLLRELFGPQDRPARARDQDTKKCQP